MSEFEVANVVGTIDFQRRIALEPLADSLAESDIVSRVDYDPSELHFIHSWFFEDCIYVAFYKNGTCSVTGVSSLDRFYEVADIVGEVLEDIVDLEIETSVNLTNIVSTAEIENLPSLEAIAIGLGLTQTEYEPEQFPALIYRPQEFDVTLLIFSTGKIIVGGTPDRTEANSALSHIENELTTLTDTQE